MPIRWRLTLWFVLMLGIILALSGVVLYVLLQHYLSAEMDNNLRVYSARVHGTLNAGGMPAPLDYQVIHSRLPPINEFASPGIYIQLLDSQGNVVVKSDSLGQQELPVSPSLVETGFEGNVSFQTLAAGDGIRVRVMASPLYLNGQTLLVEVAQSMKHVDTTVNQVKADILASILVALTLAGLSGGVIVRSALAPVSRVTDTARAIENSPDLNRRVGYRGPQDEIGRLATTFDRMLQRLDQAFKSQKHFVADASHELRSPLTVIRGNLDLLKRNLNPDDRAECLRAIESETARMTKIVTDLLLLAEVESSQSGPQGTVALKDILLGEVMRTEPLIGRRKIVVARAEDISIKGDTHKLRQLVGNLVDNAIKYTPDGGTVTVSVFRDSEWARLQVADTGIGIAPEDLPHIFDRFYRVDKARSRASGGTGLGLAIVKAIAEQHGGKVTVSSEPGEGSTFTTSFKL